MSKINEGEEYCGKLLLMVKADSPQSDSKPSTKSLSRDPSIFIIVEKMPIFKENSKHSDTEFVQWLNRKEKVEPIVKKTGQTGKVYILFVLDTEGYINDAKVIRSNNEKLNAAAIEILESSP